MHTRPRPAALAVALTVALACSSTLAATAVGRDPTVVVQAGDTLSQLAARLDVPIERLVELNRISDPNHIRVGQRLRVEAEPASEASAAAAPITHRVSAGEHLTGIAARYSTTVGAIVAANGLHDPSYIRSGQVLAIPGGSAAAAAPAPPVDSFVTGGMPSAMAALVAKRGAVGQIIAGEAQRQGVDPAFAMAVAWQESGWQQGVVSWAGAVGVMQLLPATADWIGTTMLGEPVRITDAHSNIRAGVTLLRHYLQRYGGDRGLALAAYYQGQTAADRHGIYPVSRPYIASILALQELFAG